jgi:uncharacterized RDD family membrane protein YckC
MALEPKDHPSPEPSGGSGGEQPKAQPELVLARWSTRFWAWLIDFIILTVAFEIIFAIAYPPLALPQGFNSSTDFMPVSNGNVLPWLLGTKYAIQSAMFFLYWIYFEGTTGQSIGKRFLNIKTTDLTGNRADVKRVAIESFGKAFLLPIDVFLGLIFTNDKRQRLLSRAANTIVIRENDIGKDVKYVKE